MNRPAFSSRLWRFIRFFIYALCLALVGVAALRLVVWTTGSADTHADIVGGPQIIDWHSTNPRLGGLSALLMDSDGGGLLAGGDHGVLVRAQVRRDGTGRIIALETPVLTPVSLASGRPPTTFKMDLEALTRVPDGLITAFEGFVRIERLAEPGARPVATHPWDRFVALFGNQAFEALASLPDGRVIAVTETPVAPELAGSVIYDGTRWRTGPDVPVTQGFAITGADVGPDGCLYLVERRYALASGFTSRLRRVSGGAGAWVDTVLYAAAPAQLGNVEAVATWHDGQDHIVIDLITDNGFWPLTPTRLIEFRAAPGMECTLDF